MSIKEVKKMPGGDRTGPRGLGPKTGRGRLNCAPNANAYRPHYGRGYGYRFNQTNDKTFLESEKKELEERIKEIDAELSK